MSDRIEYRAIVRRPSSILDSPEDRARGHVDEPTDYQESMEQVRRADNALRRSEESHAYVKRWEKRTVTVGELETVESEHD